MASREVFFFLTPQDEAELSRRLGMAVPNLLFIDDDRSGEPKVLPSIADASGIQVWLFEPTTGARLSWKSIAPMVQFYRSRVRRAHGPNELGVGRLSAVFPDDDEHTRALVNTVARVLRKMATNVLTTFNPTSGTRGKPIRNIWVGPGAQEWQREGRLLASNAANLYYALGD